MEARTRLILLGAVTLFVLLVAMGIVIYLSRATSGGVSLTQAPSTDLSGRLPTLQPGGATPTTTPGLTRGGVKSYTGQGFSLTYPTSWGLLACANSQNFELDPADGTDVKDIVCGVALKPVTVLVTRGLSCQGESVKIGNASVVRSKVTEPGGDINYRWCVPAGSVDLDVTHRVSASGSRATSKTDYSAQVEQMVGTVSTGGS